MAHTGACKRTLEVISGVVVSAQALVLCTDAARLVSDVGIVSVTSVRGPAVGEQGCPKRWVLVPFFCCDSDARAAHSCVCTPLQRCMFSAFPYMLLLT